MECPCIHVQKCARVENRSIFAQNRVLVRSVLTISARIALSRGTFLATCPAFAAKKNTRPASIRLQIIRKNCAREASTIFHSESGCRVERPCIFAQNRVLVRSIFTISARIALSHGATRPDSAAKNKIRPASIASKLNAAGPRKKKTPKKMRAPFQAFPRKSGCGVGRPQIFRQKRALA